MPLERRIEPENESTALDVRAQALVLDEDLVAQVFGRRQLHARLQLHAREREVEGECDGERKLKLNVSD